MSRRQFLTMAAVGVVSLPQRTAPPLGRMTLDRWVREQHRERGARVLLDGQDITDSCTFFDDLLGVADIYRRNAKGRFYLDTTGHPAMTRLQGRIEVRVP